MAQQLKRWESPRRTGRNDKGNGGQARQRQRQKQLQQLRKKLKAPAEPSPQFSGDETLDSHPFFFINPSFLVRMQSDGEPAAAPLCTISPIRA